MNPIDDFVDDAVKGDWLYLGEYRPSVPENLRAPGVAQFTSDGINYLITKEQLFLDPFAWKAVGKTRGWPFESGLRANPKGFGTVPNPNWKRLMLFSTEIIADGGDIEGALHAIDADNEDV